MSAERKHEVGYDDTRLRDAFLAVLRRVDFFLTGRASMSASDTLSKVSRTWPNAASSVRCNGEAAVRILPRDRLSGSTASMTASRLISFGPSARVTPPPTPRREWMSP